MNASHDGDNAGAHLVRAVQAGTSGRRRDLCRSPCRALGAGAIQRGKDVGAPAYELIYQSAFIAGSALSLIIAVNILRRYGGLLWWGVVFVFSLIVLHFATKPFLAVYLRSGINDKAIRAAFTPFFRRRLAAF
jgi:hypothetical protein